MGRIWLKMGPIFSRFLDPHFADFWPEGVGNTVNFRPDAAIQL